MGPQGAGTEAWEAPTPALGGGCSDPAQWRCRAQEQRVAGHRCPVPSPVCPSSPLLPPLAASGGKLGRGEWAEGSFIHSFIQLLTHSRCWGSSQLPGPRGCRGDANPTGALASVRL